MEIWEVREGAAKRTALQEITFDRGYDVVVCGLGTAGSLTAYLIAEKGLRVLGVEAFNCVGGTATIGGVAGYYFGTPGGRFEEVDRKVGEYQQKLGCTSVESRKFVTEELILEAGADILYESTVCGVYREGDRIVGVRMITPDGILSVAAKIVIDSTGDAAVVHMAGAETEYGRKQDGLVQPYSMVSMMQEDGKVRFTNFDFGRVDPRDEKQLSEALIFSRAYEMAEDRKKGEFLVHMPLIGVRESRRIVAEETVTLEDFLEDRFTKEPAFYSYADLDKHGWDIAFDWEVLGDWAIGANLGAVNVTIPVPFKALIPKGTEGLLIASRALGVDRDIASCVRMKRDMYKIAETAADMVYLALSRGYRLKEIPYEELRELLQETGCLDERYRRGYRIDGVKDDAGKVLPAVDVNWITDPDELESGLATLTPGQAIWSAKRMKERAQRALEMLLASPDENTRKHASFAWALCRLHSCFPGAEKEADEKCIALLRRMAADRDPVLLKDCRKHNQRRGCMAIYYLGRLGDVDCIEILTELITDPKELYRPVYHQGFAMETRYEIKDFNSEYFQFMSEAVMALVRIGNKNPEVRSVIRDAFYKAFDDGSFVERITTRPRMSSEGSMAANIRRVANDAVQEWQ